MSGPDYDQYDMMCDGDPTALMGRCREAERACELALPLLRRLVKLERAIIEDSEGLRMEDLDPRLVEAGRLVRSVVDARVAGENVPPA